MSAEIQVNEKFGDLRILLSGVPCQSNRGYLGYCTVVLFKLEGAWTLFDTGHYSDRYLLLEALGNVNLSPDDIRHVVLSHLHFDHILNISLFKNASITLSQAELNYARQVSANQRKDPSIPDFWPILLENRKIHTFEKSMTIGSGIEIVQMPGHTPGSSVMFYKGPFLIAVCGDAIKNSWEALTGKAAICFGNPHQAKESIKNILQTASVIIPGHDRPFMIQKGGLEFLAPFQWEVRGNIFPKEQDGLILSMNIPSGFYSDPRQSMERAKA